METHDLDISTSLDAETVGNFKSNISVEIGTRFLEHFSEQLYSSPQKAFEELISNGWDAGATFVDVFVPENLNSRETSLTVFDNGASMDEEGLKTLWKIAFSPKEQQHTQYGRQVVGKFGIGKLSTYVLANRLTYICKAEDGVIRRVTMDYGSIDNKNDPDKFVSDLELEMFELTKENLRTAIESVDNDGRLWRLLNGAAPEMSTLASQPDEFGSIISTLEPSQSGTWTLVVLSGLKDTGRNLKVGILKRMLEAALPMSSEISIQLNDEILASSKLDAVVTKRWTIGADLPFDQFEVPSDTGEDKDIIKFTADSKSFGGTEYHFVEIPGIGEVRGTITLFTDKISGGKAQERGFSNGFLVNVLGRVVNQEDPSFGADNHSHAAWARFRMAVRADELNRFLITNREQFRSTRELEVFRAFLRRCFNLARSAYNSDSNVEMPDGGDVLVKSLGVVSLAPLRSVVSETLRTQSPLPGLFDETGIVDREKARNDWRENTANHIKNALNSVRYVNTNDDEFVKFRLSDNTIVINNKHPFVAEHSKTKAEKELMRTVAMVNFLSDIYSLEAGVESDKLESIRKYRDRLMCFRARQRRQSGTHIAQILLNTQHKSNKSNEMEIVVAEALRYIGYIVEQKGGNGEPEGIASALPYPNKPPSEHEIPLAYKFTYDTKSAKGKASKTGNLTLDGVKEHKERYDANYALVVAPGFQDGSVATRCEQQGITPIKASDLGKLLEYTVEYGAIPLNTLRVMFDYHDPKDVSNWVSALKNKLDSNRKLTIDVFLKALKHLRGKVPDVLEAGTISYICRENLKAESVKAESVKDTDVINLVKGLAILVPDLVGLTDNKIVVNAAPERIAEAVKSQLEKLHSATE